MRDEPDLDLVPADVLRAMDCLGLQTLGPVGSHGTAWLGEAADGARSELHVVASVVDDQVAARADALRAVRHDDLVRVHDVLEIGPGRLALVVEHVPGPTLGQLRASRAPLSDAEAADVAIRLAGALEALHAAGTAHGAVSADHVLVRPDGRPVLVGLAACLTGSGSPTGDVGRLVATVLALMPDEDAHLAGVAPDTMLTGADAGTPGAHGGTLRDALVALVRDPVPAAAVAVTCLQVVAPEPLRLPDAALLAGSALASWHDTPAADRAAAPVRRSAERHGAQRHGAGTDRADRARPPLGAAPRGSRDLPTRREPGGPRPMRRRRPRVITATVAAVLVVAAAGAGLVALVSGGGASPAGATGGTSPSRSSEPPAAQVSEAEQDPAQAAASLTVLRAQVVASGDVAALADLEVVDGPAHAADVALLASLAGTTFEGYQVEVQDVAVLDAAVAGEEPTAGAEADEARVRVTSSASAHVRVGPDGRTTVPATEPSAVVLVLHSTGDGWRVWDVEADG